MKKTILNSVGDFINHVGEFLGCSEWMTITQDVINHFADASFDHQWIHVNPEKAQKESPYQVTIAHGYLTISLIPHFLDDIIEVKNLNQLVNYSVNKMVFHSAIPVNSRLRMKAILDSAKDLGNICKANIHCLFEIEGKEEPVLDGNIVFLYYF